MKFFTFKRIVALMLVLAIGVTLGVYFIGGMDPLKLEYDNIDFDESQFTDFTSSGGVAGTGNKYYRTDEDGNKVEVLFNDKVKVSENDKYIMYLNEYTTVFSVVEKATNRTIYTSAQNTNDATGANLIVRYAQKSNGKIMATGMDTLNFSVAFENALTGEKEKHYKINYLKDGNGNITGAQILYKVGKFSANLDYFPSIFEKEVYNSEDEVTNARNKYSLENILGGNTLFTTKDTTVTEGNEKYIVRSYTGSGLTYSQEVVDYIEANELAVVTKIGNYWNLTEISSELLYGLGKHINTADSPITMNPFISNQVYSKILAYYGGTGVALSKDTENGMDRLVYKLKEKNAVSLSSLYTYLYTSSQEVDVATKKINVFNEDLEPIISGGYHAKDSEGNYLYDEDGKPVQELFTLEKVSEVNHHFGIESSTSLQKFQVGLQIGLNEEGIVAAIMGNTLRDAEHSSLDKEYDHDFLMYAIEVLPELTTLRDTTAEGLMVIPDGSGAIINFNNQKALQNYSPYSSNVYGRDLAFALKRQQEQTQTLMFGMYGFIDKTNERGLVAVAEKGATASTLKADTPRGSSDANYIYYTTTIRQNENVTAGTGWNQSTFNKWASKLNTSDLEYRYLTLDKSELSYVGVANKYRAYLVNKYNLTDKDETENNLVDLNFLGAYEKYALLLGIKYMTDDSLTTFAEAQKIVEELLENNVDTLNVGYISWTSKEFEYETTAKLKVSKVLGGKKGLKNLNKYLTSKGIKFYPELNISTSKGYDYSFGKIKYTAKSVGNFYAEQYPFNLATLNIDKKLNPTYFLKPSYYLPVTENLMKSYNKLGLDGAYLSDLGNYRLGSYDKGNEVYPELGKLYQESAFAYVQDQVSNIKVSAPFDYALPYVQTAVDVPLVSSTYGIFDATIPFYQLVVGGLFDYTTDTVNGTSDKSSEWYFAKALETGSNLQFLVSYTDPEVLLETDYTQYYKSFYQNWKDKIIDMNTRINQTNIHGGRLIDHMIIAKDISQVKYSNGVELIVNTGSQAYNHNGTLIPAYGYVVL